MRYINQAVFEQYWQFLAGLRENGCAVVAQYCIEDIFQRTYDIGQLRKELAACRIKYI